MGINAALELYILASVVEVDFYIKGETVSQRELWASVYFMTTAIYVFPDPETGSKNVKLLLKSGISLRK